MSHTTVMQDAHIPIPSPAQLQELFLYDQHNPEIDVAFCGQPLTRKQAQHLTRLLTPDNASQVIVTLRPDVRPKVTLDYVAFSLYRPGNTLPDDTELASLYKNPLVQYNPRKPSIASRLATLLRIAHT